MPVRVTAYTTMHKAVLQEFQYTNVYGFDDVVNNYYKFSIGSKTGTEFLK